MPMYVLDAEFVLHLTLVQVVLRLEHGEDQIVNFQFALENSPMIPPLAPVMDLASIQTHATVLLDTQEMHVNIQFVMEFKATALWCAAEEGPVLLQTPV
jgi:hypothetical protein